MIFDLIAAHQPQSAAPAWTPAQLFQNGELGYWLDASDLSTLFQDSAGTVPVTAVGQPVGLWKNKIGQVGFNFLQAIAADQPTLQENTGGKAIRYDGSGDQLSNSLGGNLTNAGVTIAIGQKKGATAAGERMFYAPAGTAVSIQNQAAGNVFGQMFGSTLHSTGVTSITAANVILMYAQPSTIPLTLRVNGTANSSASPPTATTMSNVARIVGDVSNDCDISQVILINRVLSPGEISLLEAFIASKQ